MFELIRGSYDDALYKSKYTLLYLLLRMQVLLRSRSLPAYTATATYEWI